MTPSLRALANAGVPVLEAAPLAPGGVAAPTLLAELYVFYGDSVTSRLPRVRSDDARAAWLNEQLETLTPLFVQHEAADLYRALADETEDEDGVARARVVIVMPTRSDRAGVPRIYQGEAR